jgi:aminomethyltransferase
VDALQERYIALGAAIADDGIPQHFGDLAAEYEAALNHAVLLDRSHEARLRLDGEDRYALIQRMSTHDVLHLAVNSGRPTIFTNPNGRVIDRAEVYAGENHALLIGGPGRIEPLRSYIQRNIFFRDKVRAGDLTTVTRQFGLHGPQAGHIADAVAPGASALPLFGYLSADIDGTQVMVARAKPLSGDHFRIIAATEDAAAVWDALLEAGREYGLKPAGSQLYNVLRIRAGSPGAGRELSEEYIPLELGLWDEVSFAKGCYTGQEIIARMESRGKLAKTIATVRLDAASESPVDLLIDGKRSGTLTSAVTAPDGTHYGIALLKPDHAHAGAQAVTTEGVTVTVTGLPGTQPRQA